MTIFYYKGKMKRRKSDDLFSKYIRTRDGRCMYRFKCYGSTVDWRYDLDCSHWQKRGKEGTRFDVDNCDAACKACHAYVEDTVEGIKELKAWKLNQLGEQRCNAVLLRAHNYCKKDEVLAKLFVKGLIKQAGYDIK